MKFLFTKIFFLSIIIIGFSALALAQDTQTAPSGDPLIPTSPNQAEPRAAFLKLLQLTPDQEQRLKHLNAERKPVIEAAQAKLRNAIHDLDEAIYADNYDEAVFRSRLNAVQIAQSEVQNIRYLNELSMRRILTPEQVSIFRGLRERFSAARENLRKQQPALRRARIRQTLKKMNQQQPTDTRSSR